MDVEIRSLSPDDRLWLSRFIAAHWDGDIMVVHGVSYRPAELPGFCAMDGDTPVGVVTYNIEGPDCEIVSLDSLRRRRGIGRALLQAVETVAQERGSSRLWLVTTNDNLHALRFY